MIYLHGKKNMLQRQRQKHAHKQLCHIVLVFAVVVNLDLMDLHHSYYQTKDQDDDECL